MSPIPPPIQKSAPLVSKRSLGLAGVAAVVACVACCALPLVLAAGAGGGGAALSSLFGPGTEIVVGAAAFVVVLGALLIRSKLARRGRATCGPACSADGACCDRGTRRAPPT